MTIIANNWLSVALVAASILAGAFVLVMAARGTLWMVERISAWLR